MGPDEQDVTIAPTVKKETGLRSNVSGSMTAFYALLCRADPSEQDSGAPLKLRYSPRTSMTSLPGRAKESMSQEKPEQREAANGNVAKQLTKSDLPMSTSKENSLRFEPTMHITIQIHIPSDASAELIDNLFASMAKHLSFERQNR